MSDEQGYTDDADMEVVEDWEEAREKAKSIPFAAGQRTFFPTSAKIGPSKASGKPQLTMSHFIKDQLEDGKNYNRSVFSHVPWLGEQFFGLLDSHKIQLSGRVTKDQILDMLKDKISEKFEITEYVSYRAPTEKDGVTYGASNQVNWPKIA